MFLQEASTLAHTETNIPRNEPETVSGLSHTLGTTQVQHQDREGEKQKKTEQVTLARDRNGTT